MADRTPIDAVKHKDRRTNIPTEELRDFMPEELRNTQPIVYPRDTTLDPQLVWRGKDQQDLTDLSVDVRPIYIQEKVHPQALVEALREKPVPVDRQMSLFSDFEGIKFDDLVDFYRHNQKWTNRMILGDSLEVMASLSEKEGLKGQVQTIYIDPPYGIKFGANWQVSAKKRDLKETRSEDVSRQPEQIQAFRDTWELGVHSFLAYLRDRFTVALDLLTESGSIFVQIGIQNVHLVRSVLDEVFGAENFVSMISFATTSGFESNELARAGDYLLWYAKNAEQKKYRPLFELADKEPGQGGYRWVMFPNGTYRGLTKRELDNEDPFPNGQVYKPDNIQSQGTASEDQAFWFRGKEYAPGSNNHWKANFPVGMERLAKANRLHVAKNSIQYVRYADDFAWKAINNFWTDTLTGQYTDDKVYVVQTNTKVVERCLLMTTDPGDLVLDPTCGSGTTAYVAEQFGRRWITIDTSRVAITLARARLMGARYPYYLLADSKEGFMQNCALTGQALPASLPSFEGDIRKGFVNQRANRIKLGSIANNEEIDRIWVEWEPKLTAQLAQLNTTLKAKWQEWEVPSEADPTWPQATLELFEAYWAGRLERQSQIDAAIAQRAETEYLVDRPIPDPKRFRVTGPFTVESLSPFRSLSAHLERPRSEEAAEHEPRAVPFEQMIIETLQSSGVQNARKDERLVFNRIDPHAGTWIHAVGEYQENDQPKRAAICIGPERGTVGPELLKEAAKEAVKGLGYDLLIICGFSFDPHVSEEATNLGRLPILITRMNPDLSMGDELLKKTGKGNLFTVFGEPDVDIQPAADGMLSVRINGVDVYDPTTGEVRPRNTNQIACWFIDTDYSGESFCVRHAYFCGVPDPYENLKRALKAEVDANAWASVYATVSRPFAKPKSGKIAIKVINDYGDEVLKVYTIQA